jgi:transcriptional regulator with XRE-family HTH domain
MATATTPSGDTEQLRIGATLRALRTARGVRVGQFAAKLEISHAYLSNIEAGRKPLTAALTKRAADLLNVPPIALVRPDFFPDEQVVA